MEILEILEIEKPDKQQKAPLCVCVYGSSTRVKLGLKVLV